MERSVATTVEDLIERREALRESGREIDVEELTRDVPEEARREFLERLARIELAERALEGFRGEAGRDSTPSMGVAGRYVDLRYLGHGGMGRVYSARDAELDRRVAYKVMRLRGFGAGDEEARARFFREAEITSRLNHPGIAPVYGRVTDDSGVPAYAMGFVSGRTMAEAIEVHRRIDRGDREARARSRAGLLGAFLSVCEIVAYAHSERVVHGDIKPLNIMIDDYGATRLVDWGLARVVEEGESEWGEEGPRPGTPEFRSSARGRASFSSDIFALGRTLESILSDGVAVAGVGADRARSSDAPRALWSVAERATRSERSARYGTVSALAADVRSVLADRAIAGHRDPWTTRLRRWGSRNRPAVAAGAAVLFVATAAGPVVGLRERELRRRAEQERRRAVELTLEMLDQVDRIGRFQATLPGSREMLDRASRLVEELARDMERNGEDAGLTAASFARAGRINDSLGRLEEAEACFRKAASLADRRLRAGVGADRGGDSHLKATALRELGVVHARAGRFREASACWTEALEALGGVEAPTAEHELTRGRIWYARGNGLMLEGDQAGAQRMYEEARGILEPPARGNGSDPRFAKALSSVFSNWGYSLFREAVPSGARVADGARLAESRRFFREALRIRRELMEREPGNPEAMSNVAASLTLLANATQVEGPSGYEAAEGLYREAGELLEALTLRYPAMPSPARDLGRVYSNRNLLLTAENRFEDALAASDAALEVFRRLIGLQPDSIELRRELGVILTNRAGTLDRMNRREEAERVCHEAALTLAETAGKIKEAGGGVAAFPANEAVRLLNELNRRGYFRGERAGGLANERLFDPLRGRADFPKP